MQLKLFTSTKHFRQSKLISQQKSDILGILEKDS